MSGHFADRIKGLGLLRLLVAVTPNWPAWIAAEGVRAHTLAAAHRLPVVYGAGVLRLGERGDGGALYLGLSYLA